MPVEIDVTRLGRGRYGIIQIDTETGESTLVDVTIGADDRIHALEDPNGPITAGWLRKIRITAIETTILLREKEGRKSSAA